MKKLIGKTVMVKMAKGVWASSYIDQVGIVESRCGLYRRALIVRFEDGCYASFYPKELEVQVS